MAAEEHSVSAVVYKRGFEKQRKKQTRVPIEARGVWCGLL